MKRLTTDNPQTNTEALLNFAYAKDGRVFLRYADGEENKDLCEYVSNYACSKGCAGTFPQDVMEGSCLECDCEMALLYVAAVQAAELRERLKVYEDAEEQGRMVVLPCKVGDTVFRLVTPRDAPATIAEIQVKTLDQAAALVGRIGKRHLLISYYATREEAEAALAGLSGA